MRNPTPENDPSYEFVECPQCGRLVQPIDYASSQHRLSCDVDGHRDEFNRRLSSECDSAANREAFTRAVTREAG